MKKALKILLIVDACVAVAFLIGYEIREVLLVFMECKLPALL